MKIKKICKRLASVLIVIYHVIACKSCTRSFDKEDHSGFCPFCGADNN